MTIRKKSYAFAGIVGAVLLTAILIALFMTHILAKANEDMYQKATKGIENISLVQEDLNVIRIQEILSVNYGALGQADKISELEGTINKSMPIGALKLEIEKLKTFCDELLKLLPK